ncbi:MAG: AbrB/MazE/SpoVT family DNA-binding domain-containing protein [Planctomycetes bacterium]|nr:AbrB/MazE/SpoVT family DNA-binding domain-containing protein [Planctomycetota bacterium]
MKTKIIKIGNSRGIRIPKVLLEETGLGQEIEIRAEEDHLVIGPVAADPVPARKGWGSAFKAMGSSGDDELLDRDRALPTRWEEEDWKWQ